MIIRAVLGVTERERLEPFRRAIREAVAEVSPWPLFLSPLRHEFFGFGPWARFMRHKRRFDEMLAAEITAARALDTPREDVLSRLVHALDDTIVPPDNSRLFFGALQRAGVPATLHLYEAGFHGFGLGHPGSPAAAWPVDGASWLHDHAWRAPRSGLGASAASGGR